MMAQLLAMQKQMAEQAQSAAPPAQDNSHPDMAAMMAELQALRAQVAAQANAEAEGHTKDNGGG